MTKTNITLKLDTQLLRQIKIVAARRETSISSLLTAALEEQVRKDLDYDRAKEAALADLDSGFDLGFHPPASRDELHER